MPPIQIIVNASGGSFTAGQTEAAIRAAFDSRSMEYHLHLAGSGDELVEFAKMAVASDAETIVAGGGDGTVSAVAGIMHGSGKTFGVLPLGTLNNFSKDLRIPQDITGAIRVIAAGNIAEIDLAEVNGRVFINNSSIGLYPSIVRKREEQQRLGKGKWNAAFWSAIQMFRNGRFVQVRIETNGKTFVRKTPFVFVGNNEYVMDLYNIGRRAAINEGKLSVYFLRHGGRMGVVKLILRTLTGTVKQWHEFEAIVTESLTIDTKRAVIPVAFDGEVGAIETPLHYRSLPRALKVIVPEQMLREVEN
ncbi:MAG: diacylglycerol kinase family protein [Acidobacteriota bacterium]